MTKPSGKVGMIDQQGLGPRDLLDLFSAVLPIFLNTLPLAKNIKEEIRVQRTIPLIRAQLEIIGLSLESLSVLGKLQYDSLDWLLADVDKVLTGMETFISWKILDFCPDERNYYSTTVS